MNEEFHIEEYDDDESVEYYAIRPNKTRIKKEISEVFGMVEEIIHLGPAQIKELELPENIENAVLDAARMGLNAARKRLLKYITAQLRKVDIQPVQEKLARLKNRSAHAVREHHQIERWRDQLLSGDGDRQLSLLMNEFPAMDSQHIRQLQRNALKETQQDKPPKSARLLYKYLKDVIVGADQEQ